jgi:hypothetical protein
VLSILDGNHQHTEERGMIFHPACLSKHAAAEVMLPTNAAAIRKAEGVPYMKVEL